jgi:hypothetical protein
MKKTALPVWLLLTCAYHLNAQHSRPVNPAKDKIEFQGYTVRLLPAMSGTFGYDILSGKALVLRQTCNPFTMAPVGLRQKADVYKIAKWQIVHMDRPGRATLRSKAFDEVKMPGLQVENKPKAVFLNKPLGKELARELNIDLH